MAISDAQYTAWLSDPSAIRCTLIDVVVRVSGAETTRYLSTTPYTMNDATISYMAVGSMNIKYTETLNISGSSMSIGDLEIANPNGIRDSWLSDVWEGRSVVAYIGDPRWVKNDFRVIFSGIVSKISSRSRYTINLQLRDKLQRLNTAISDIKLGGSTSNKDNLLPLTFGEVHNISPFLINPATLSYQVHNGAIERIIECRDNGVIIPTTNNLANGTFTLDAPLIGVLTCSVQGTKPSAYSNTIADAIQLIVTSYGTSTTRFVTGDLDTANLAAFNSVNTMPIGYYLTGRENVINVCQALANSVGAQVSMSRLGKLRILQLSLPVTSTFTIYEKDIVQNSLSISNTSDVVSAVKLSYCKNWTVQNDLQTGIPQEHKDLYSLEWLSTTQTDSSVAAIYKQSAEPVEVSTYLQTGASATAEALRRLNMFKVPRTTFKFVGLPCLMELELGQGITLVNRRFGLSGAGLPGIITSLSPNWLTGRVDIEVLI